MGVQINGKALAVKYRQEIREYIDNLISQNRRLPCLSAVIVGDDGGSLYYLNNVVKLCNELGVTCRVYHRDADISENSLIELIMSLNGADDVDGIMMFLPLPKHIDEKKVTSLISPKKDIDCLTDINNGKFYKGETSFVPCTPMSVMNLIRSTSAQLTGKHAVVIGRSNIVGKPVAQLLLQEDCTVTVCHSKTVNLKEICSNADILVSAIGKPGFVDENYIKEGSIVIDVGTTSVDGKITGDILYNKVVDKAGYVTPVPGGVGAMTTTMLIKNVCEAYKRNVY
jgi:methenyltetrahydrofolate cyclohydrolase (EC 3.5.4.9)/5,10-methylenetetrahydrofolate dehydrogenase (NADP+) (EC 1.5.1.5)